MMASSPETDMRLLFSTLTSSSTVSCHTPECPRCSLLARANRSQEVAQHGSELVVEIGGGHAEACYIARRVAGRVAVTDHLRRAVGSAHVARARPLTLMMVAYFSVRSAGVARSSSWKLLRLRCPGGWARAQ
jgi:hypothetical protein